MKNPELESKEILYLQYLENKNRSCLREKKVTNFLK